MEHTLSKLYADSRESEMVLVGIGEEFQYNWDMLQQNERWNEIADELDEREEYQWVIPFLYKTALMQIPDKRLEQAYKTLQEILEGQNYFILSAAIDDYIYRYSFQKDRIVTPCGGFSRMQCDCNCNGELYDIDEKLSFDVEAYFYKKKPLDAIQEPKCRKCGESLKFNQIGAKKYAQEGYLPQWEKYTKWLQGTVNKKLCVIELGAGMQIPTLIRWPFEKIIYYNHKSFLYRIHSSFYQLGEKMGGRGLGIKENSISFLANGFVKYDCM